MFQQATAYRATWNVFKEAGNVSEREFAIVAVYHLHAQIGRRFFKP